MGVLLFLIPLPEPAAVLPAPYPFPGFLRFRGFFGARATEQPLLVVGGVLDARPCVAGATGLVEDREGSLRRGGAWNLGWGRSPPGLFRVTAFPFPQTGIVRNGLHPLFVVDLF